MDLVCLSFFAYSFDVIKIRVSQIVLSEFIERTVKDSLSKKALNSSKNGEGDFFVFVICAILMSLMRLSCLVCYKKRVTDVFSRVHATLQPA